MLFRFLVERDGVRSVAKATCPEIVGHLQFGAQRRMRNLTSRISSGKRNI